jgi:glycosyltransferase involved in cell wall biosynthesis
MAEPENSLPEHQFQLLAEEPHLATGWVVASTYSASTLVEHGIPASRIHVVPYGVNRHAFPPPAQSGSERGPLTVIFIGAMIQRKGLTDLLDAARLVNSSHLRILLCGRGYVDRELLSHYEDLDMDVHIGLPRNQLVRKLHESHLFVLPSLSEGFAHVILEAMSAGLPVLTTENTAGPDLFNDGVQGFVVPIRSPYRIAEKLTWALEHRPELASMGQLASTQAGVFTWDRFHAGIRRAYHAMYTES